MTHFVGLTWDHPRGRVALESTARDFSAAGRAHGGDTLAWDVQPLEGFESAPIAETAARYDLVVLDHPHLGDALAADCIVPLDELFDAETIAGWSRDAIGPSLDSYVVDGRAYALPLDAATQVSARRPDVVPEAPVDWDAVRALSREGGVAPSLAGPHAFLTLCSFLVGAGVEPAVHDEVAPAEPWDAAIDLLAELAGRAPRDTIGQNPIALLERMSTAGDLRYVPLIYGYVSYAQRSGAEHVAFGAPPVIGGRIGSTLGGTGIAITRRSTPSPALLDHIAWLLSDEAQRGRIPADEGQPSSRAAWSDPAVDGAAGGFYSATASTIEQAWVRPRFAGFVPVQAEASALVRDAIAGRRSSAEARELVSSLLRDARDAAATAGTAATTTGARS